MNNGKPLGVAPAAAIGTSRWHNARSAALMVAVTDSNMGAKVVALAVASALACSQIGGWTMTSPAASRVTSRGPAGALAVGVGAEVGWAEGFACASRS